jgi:hypothetical protein
MTNDEMRAARMDNDSERHGMATAAAVLGDGADCNNRANR